MANHPSSHVHRFDFASFDEQKEPKPPKAVKEKPPSKPLTPPPMEGGLPLQLPPPTFSDKDLQAAKADAQAQGYREGYSAAQVKFSREAAAREETIRSVLEVIANRITLAAEAHAAAVNEREQIMGKLILAAARKLAGDALRREPYAAVESLLRECTALIEGELKVTISVSPALAAGLKQRIDTLKPMLQGFSGELVVVEEPALLDLDCRVEWRNGYGERDSEALWHAVEAIIMKTSFNS